MFGLAEKEMEYRVDLFNRWVIFLWFYLKLHQELWALMQQLKFSFLFIPLEFVIAGSSITLWTLEWINLCLPVYLIFHLCFTITGLHIHVLTSASRRATPEFSMYFFIIPYVFLNCCYICIFPFFFVLAFVYVKYIRSMLYVLLLTHVWYEDLLISKWHNFTSN